MAVPALTPLPVPVALRFWQVLETLDHGPAFEAIDELDHALDAFRYLWTSPKE